MPTQMPMPMPLPLPIPILNANIEYCNTMIACGITGITPVTEVLLQYRHFAAVVSGNGIHLLISN